VEYIETRQWFIKVLEQREQLLAAGRAIRWVPAEMQARYESWVNGLSWDWAISRQRYFGVPFPVWYCKACGQIILAEESQLPVDPLVSQPLFPCPACSGSEFSPETDVMDTWATSSMTPQIAGRWLADPELYRRVFPMNLRPQAHDIIRTWAFYTIVKSLHHFGQLPWNTVAISGHGLSPTGTKISKSRGNSQSEPLAIMARYSADAIRYWAAGAGFGRDSLISEEQFKTGQKLVTKLWNVFRFSLTFLADYQLQPEPPAGLTPTDNWLLARLQQAIGQATSHFENYEFGRARSTVEDFFWNVLADNYIEMAKYRLYNAEDKAGREAARYSLYQALLAVIKLLAPILPHVTEEIYQLYFARFEPARSIHLSAWPTGQPHWSQAEASAFGDILVAIATTVRRFKSSSQLSLGADLARLILVAETEPLRQLLRQAQTDIQSVTRARQVFFESPAANGVSLIQVDEELKVGIVAG
jgi:valyl-tRNA synthetase